MAVNLRTSVGRSSSVHLGTSVGTSLSVYLKPKKKKKSKLGRPKLRSYKALRNQAWDTFSKWVRQNEKGVCFTCGKKDDWKNMDAGHYIHKNCLDFEEFNIHCQCTACNRYLSGNTGIYAEKLVLLYGIDAVTNLRRLSNQVRKFSRDELEEIINKYSPKEKEEVGG